MTYWRMQVHPAQPALATRHTVQSLAAGFIGLDFVQEVGDMMRCTQQDLPAGQRDYWHFAHGMAIGDKVLIIAHNFPLALATVAGDYNYIRTTVPELGVWFRHFRRVQDVKYYGDLVTNAHNWQQLVMTDAISILNNPGSQSYQLIQTWP